MDLERIAQEAQALHRLGASETPEEIELYTEYLLDFAQSLVERTVPWAKPSTKATPWWTEEIEDLVREERRLRNA